MRRFEHIVVVGPIKKCPSMLLGDEKVRKMGNLKDWRMFFCKSLCSMCVIKIPENSPTEISYGTTPKAKKRD